MSGTCYGNPPFCPEHVVRKLRCSKLQPFLTGIPINKVSESLPLSPGRVKPTYWHCATQSRNIFALLPSLFSLDGSQPCRAANAIVNIQGASFPWEQAPLSILLAVLRFSLSGVLTRCPGSDLLCLLLRNFSVLFPDSTH